mmetsp:Transcript_5328/g.13873  ORF Transcript_5328/g.13873 Transcript_5328/m.13873 type:complete len:176 (-) Transcript_5328:56-583(-)
MQPSFTEQNHPPARLSFENLCDAYLIDSTSPLSRAASVTPRTAPQPKPQPASTAVYGDLIDSVIGVPASAAKNEPLEFGVLFAKGEDSTKPVSRKRARTVSEGHGEQLDEKVLKSREVSKRHRLKQRTKLTELESKVRQLEKEKQSLQDMLRWMMQSGGSGAPPAGSAISMPRFD